MGRKDKISTTEKKPKQNYKTKPRGNGLIVI